MDILKLIGRDHPLFDIDLSNHEQNVATIVRRSSFLVVGGAGSIGQAVTVEIFKRNPRKLHVIDLSENNLVELVRTLRSQYGYIDGEFKTYAIDCGGLEADRFISSQSKYDYILNLSAMKHVRNEEDPYTLMRMLQVNVQNNLKVLNFAAPDGGINYFSVSTDKATNPVNAMGASKRVMELFLMRESERNRITTARFANVAFSDGSLLRGFQLRLQKGQPLSAPADVRRYFITPEESGQLCLLSSLIGANRDVFFPKLSEDLVLTSFTDIAMRFLEAENFQPYICSSEEEARGKSSELIAKGQWPCYFFDSNTTGEKDFEEFYTESEELELDSFNNIGIIKSNYKYESEALQEFSKGLEDLRLEEAWSKNRIISLLEACVPEFSHKETHRYLDHRM